MGEVTATARPLKMNEPILIIGCGAMACFFAGRIAASGQDVKILATWPEGINALKKNGVRIVDGQGHEHTYPIQVSSDPRSYRNSICALILVKSWQTKRAAKQLQFCLDEQGLALTLQNGLGNYEILCESLGAERVAVGVTTLGATLLSPGRVRGYKDGEIILGKHRRLNCFFDPLRAAGFKVRSESDITGMLWSKLLVNAVINPITTLLKITNGQILKIPSARSLMNSIIDEVCRVVNAQNIQLPYLDPYQYVNKIITMTSGNSSSMLKDWQRGAPTEIDAISGAIVRHGQLFGVSTPVNQTLLDLIKAKLEKNQFVSTEPQSQGSGLTD